MSEKNDSVEKNIKKLLLKTRKRSNKSVINHRGNKGLTNETESSSKADKKAYFFGENSSKSSRMLKKDILKIKSKYGILKCDYKLGHPTNRCNGLIIAKSGQKTGQCLKCGRRRKLNKCRLVYQSDNRKKVREAVRIAKEFGGIHK
ncbi:MAG: hypothetical protein ACLFUR_00665 [Candidatus Hadarchaeia archaeon]